jgi:hypothetical protein
VVIARPSTWLPLIAATAVTALTLAVTTFGETPPSVDPPAGRAVVQPAARVVEGGATVTEAPEPPRLPGWCRRADACVDRHARLAWLTRHGHGVLGPVPVALGGRGHRTPRGHFHVEWKAADYTSTEYGLPMPFSVFFATGGIAFHAGPLDQPSHGCVHLRRHDASRFFDRLRVGDTVIVR